MKNRRTDAINREIEMEMEVDEQRVRYPSSIISVEPDTVEILAPMEDGEAIDVPFGTEVILNEKPLGKPPEQYKLVALDQDWDDETETWDLTLAQPNPLLEPDERPVKQRELVYEYVSIPVLLKQVQSEKTDIAADVFETQSVNLSASGMLATLAEGEERPLPRGTQVIAEFRLESEAITRDFRLVATVIREFSRSTSGGNTRLVGLSFDTPEFDAQDRQDLIEFVLNLQIANYYNT